MFLSIGKDCKGKEYFDVPHLEKPISSRRIIKNYPNFAKIFDGQSVENTLSFYYKKNKLTNVYELIDEDAEIEVAELLGVEIKSFDIEDEDVSKSKGLSEEQIKDFKEQLKEIKGALEEHYTK